METSIVVIVAFLASILTFFSGFGLGTLLSPIFMLFFPVELAITLTGIVHFFNNIFKLFLVGRYANKEIIIRFGLPAILAALLGSNLLGQVSSLKPIFSYQFGKSQFEIYPIKLMIAILLIIFSIIELLPYFKKLEFSKNKLPLGGIISGFFGGLSGNQGALRSAFLIKAGLSKEAFIGSTAVISTCIDITRLSIYTSLISINEIQNNKKILLSATFAAILGAIIGNKLLKKVTFVNIQILVTILLVLIALGLGTGLL